MVGLIQDYNDTLIEKILVQLNKESDTGFKKYLNGLKDVLVSNIGSSFLYYYAYMVSKKLRDDYDHVTIISGREGVGKSTFADKLVVMISPNARIDHVCYKPMDLVDAMESATAGDTIWIDEGALFLFSREAMGASNKMLIKLLTISRQLNLHLVICIPNFFTIDTYIREHRVNSLFHITKRGSFRYFSEHVVKLVSAFGKKTKNVLSKDITIKHGFSDGQFNKYFPSSLSSLNKDVYEQRKTLNMQEHLKELREELGVMGEKSTGFSNVDDNAMKGCLKVKDFAKQMNLHPNSVRRMISENRLAYKKVGGIYYVDTEKASEPC